MVKKKFIITLIFQNNPVRNPRNTVFSKVKTPLKIEAKNGFIQERCAYLLKFFCTAKSYDTVIAMYRLNWFKYHA